LLRPGQLRLAATIRQLALADAATPRIVAQPRDVGHEPRADVALPRTCPQFIHIPAKFVDDPCGTTAKFVDKRLVVSLTRPVWFVLPEGAVGTVRRGEE